MSVEGNQQLALAFIIQMLHILNEQSAAMRVLDARDNSLRRVPANGRFRRVKTREGPVPPLAAIVDRAGQRLCPAARLTFDQDRKERPGGPIRQSRDPFAL
jgi:hypothetical protein